MNRTWLVTSVAAAVAAVAGGCGMMDRAESAMGATGAQQITLSGSNEVPAVTSRASGNASVTVGADCSVSGTIRAADMTATAAHIHEGASGANGPVAVGFTKTGDNTFSAPAGAKFTPAQCDAYKKGNTYVNVHSAAHPGGEIRGQLRGR